VRRLHDLENALNALQVENRELKRLLSQDSVLRGASSPRSQRKRKIYGFDQEDQNLLVQANPLQHDDDVDSDGAGEVKQTHGNPSAPDVEDPETDL